MGLNHILLKNSWNETHYQNKKLLRQYAVPMNALGPSLDFINFLTKKNLHISKDMLDEEIIEEYIYYSNLFNGNCEKCGHVLTKKLTYCPYCGINIK